MLRLLAGSDFETLSQDIEKITRQIALIEIEISNAEEEGRKDDFNQWSFWRTKEMQLRRKEEQLREQLRLKEEQLHLKEEQLRIGKERLIIKEEQLRRKEEIALLKKSGLIGNQIYYCMEISL